MKQLYSVMLFIVLLLPAAVLRAADTVVVWNLEHKTGVSAAQADTVSALLISAVERRSGLNVIGEEEMVSVVKGEETRMQCGASDSACIAEIGAALGAPLSVSGTLSKMGDYWIISVRLIDVRLVEVKGRASRRFKGSMNDLVESVGPMVCELFNVPCEDDTADNNEEMQTSFDVKNAPADGKPSPVQQGLVDLPAPRVPWKRIAGWSLTGVGAGMMVLGVAGQVKMSSEKDGYVSDGSGTRDDWRTWRSVSVAGYVTGSVCIAGGVSLLMWDILSARKNPDERTVSWYLLPSSDGVSAGVTARW